MGTANIGERLASGEQIVDLYVSYKQNSLKLNELYTYQPPAIDEHVLEFMERNALDDITPGTHGHDVFEELGRETMAAYHKAQQVEEDLEFAQHLDQTLSSYLYQQMEKLLGTRVKVTTLPNTGIAIRDLGGRWHSDEYLGKPVTTAEGPISEVGSKTFRIGHEGRWGRLALAGYLVKPAHWTTGVSQVTIDILG
jgi:hypothetical protein